MPPPDDFARFERDLRLMDRRELQRAFRATSSGRLVPKRLIRALVVQAWRAIQAGEQDPVQGNLRTFWYRWVKPVEAKLPPSWLPKGGTYALTSEVFVELVLERGWLTYADFDFTDENWAHRFVGAQRPEVLVFSEKAGWIRFLRRCHEELGVSALALGGQPSALTSEYTARALREALAPNTPLRLLGIVDWDPAGAIIARAFAQHLHAFGFEHTEPELLIRPEHYAPDELQLYATELRSAHTTKRRLWLEQGGGVHGQPRALASESMPWARLRQLLERKLASS